MSRSGRQPLVLFICLLVSHEDTLVIICSQSLHYFFDMTAQSSSVPLKAKLCRMLSLIGLVASVGKQIGAHQFWKMLTKLICFVFVRVCTHAYAAGKKTRHLRNGGGVWGWEMELCNTVFEHQTCSCSDHYLICSNFLLVPRFEVPRISPRSWRQDEVRTVDRKNVDAHALSPRPGFLHQSLWL